jgi:hypothetical protein
MPLRPVVPIRHDHGVAVQVEVVEQRVPGDGHLVGDLDGGPHGVTTGNSRASRCAANANSRVFAGSSV